jgi:hypothetical protein
MKKGMREMMEEMNPSKKMGKEDMSAKMDVLKELLQMAESELKGRSKMGLDGAKAMKVSVMAKDKESLKEGLEKAEDVLESEMMPEEMSEESEDEMSDESEDEMEEMPKKMMADSSMVDEEEEEPSFFKKKKKV